MARYARVYFNTAAAWTAANEVLRAGGMGFETDTNLFKIGDGATAWDDLTHITDGFDAGILAERTAARTLQNARIIPRIHSVTAPGATPTINLDTYDRSVWTGINANITAVNVAGVAAPWQEYVLVLKDDGSARTLNFGTAFRVMSGVTAPTTTVAGKWIYIRMIANTDDNKFDIYDIKVQP